MSKETETLKNYISSKTNGAFDEIAFPLICKNNIGEVCTIEDSVGNEILAARYLNVLEGRALTVLITALLNQHHKELSRLVTPKLDEQLAVRHKVSDIECANCKFSKRTEFLLPNNIREAVIRCHLNPPQVVVDHFEYPKVATIENGFTWELGVCSNFKVDQVKLD